MKCINRGRGKQLRITALALFLLLAAFAGLALAADSKGKVETSQPGFWAMREGNRVDLSTGDDIYEFDILKTDASGGGTIRFADDTVLEVRDNSEIDIKEVVFSDERNRFNVGVVEGTARVITGAIVRQNPRGFKVTTPKSTIGIRGTDLEAGFDPSTETSSLSVSETENSVTFTDKATGFSVTGAKGLSVTSDGLGGLTINGKSYNFNDPAQVDQAAKDLAGVADVSDPSGSDVDNGAGSGSSGGGGAAGGGGGGGGSGSSGGGGGGGGGDNGGGCNDNNSSPPK